MTVIILALLFALIPTLSSYAQGQARIYLQPVPLQDERQLVVALMVADVIDLYGADVQLRYDPSQLQAEDANPRLEGVQIAPGPFLAADERFVVTNKVDATAGLITFAATLLNPAPPVSGEGVLATIAFRILGNGPYRVEIVRAQLVSASLTTIPVVSEGLLLSAPSDASLMGRRSVPPWGWWALGIGGLLLVIVVFSIAYQRRRATVLKGAIVVHDSSIPIAEQSAGEVAIMLTEQGRRAMQQGNLELAHELFSRAVERDPANSEAWLGKGLVAHQISEKRICFQRVLALDPSNPIAQAELQQLERTN
ncbi:MAG: tetratricopeptide repeat protein [Anaerolineae bacterium]